MKRTIKVIGLGGIGTALIPILCRMLCYHPTDEFTLTLVDGDSYEPKNAKRQSFRSYGPKAVVKTSELAPAFSNLHIRPQQEYVTTDNVRTLIEEGDTIFLAVDNHKTRKVVSDHCRTLSNITLISGGNELTDGNVQVYIRRNGEDVTYPIDEFHPEIANPKDTLPNEQGCEDALEEGNQQILEINDMVAASMRMNFWRIEEGLLKGLKLYDGIGETYINLKNGLIHTVSRLVPRKEG